MHRQKDVERFRFLLSVFTLSHLFVNEGWSDGNCSNLVVLGEVSHLLFWFGVQKSGPNEVGVKGS